MKELYRSKAASNIIWQGEYEHYLLINNDSGGVATVYSFDGELSRVRNGERKTVVEWLISYIIDNGPFRIHDMGDTHLEETLFKVYHGLDYGCSANPYGIHLKVSDPITIAPISDAEEAGVFRTYPVIDFGISNIQGKSRRAVQK